MHRFVFVASFLAALLGLPQMGAAQDSDPPGRHRVAPGDTLLLSLSIAQQRALRENPAFLAEAQEVEVARGELRQARLYSFNPELDFQAPGLGTEGALGEYEASLSQEIEWPGQRGLRIRAARFALDRAEATVGNAARRTLADVSTAFYAAIAAERRLAVARELADLNEQLLAATRIQAREGEISVMEANLAEIEAGRARARVLAAQREATSERLELQRLTGIPPERTVGLEGASAEMPAAPVLDTDSLVALALARRPDVAAQTRAVDQYETLARLARREAIPNPRVGVFVEREEFHTLSSGGPGAPVLDIGLGPPRVGVGVSVPVPIFNRNQGIAQERVARAEQARLSRQATELAVRTQVIDAVRAYRAASEEARLLEQDVLQPARSNQRLLETAFREGKVGLPTLVLLRNQLLDAELAYWDAWLVERRALVDLQSATGMLGSGPNPNSNEDR